MAGIPADQHALLPPHQLVHGHVEAELAPTDVGAVKMEDPRTAHRPARHGGGALAGPDPVDVQGAADVLGPMLAAVDIGIVVAQPGDVAHRARDGDPARFGQHLDAFGQVDAVAEDIVTRRVDDDLAEMNADAEQEALLLGETLVEPRHALLDVDGHLDGGDRRAELGEHGIARAVNQRAAGPFNGGLPDLAAR